MPSQSTRFTSFYIVLPWFTMVYHVLPCFTMFYHVLPCFTMFLSCFTFPCPSLVLPLDELWNSKFHTMPCLSFTGIDLSMSQFLPISFYFFSESKKAAFSDQRKSEAVVSPCTTRLQPYKLQGCTKDPTCVSPADVSGYKLDDTWPNHWLMMRWVGQVWTCLKI